MKYSLFITLALVACSTANTSSTENISPANTNSALRKGFIKLDEQLLPVEYRLDGDVALIDEHVPVSRNLILDPEQDQTNLTGFFGTNRWPNGVVPFKSDADVPNDVIQHITREYRKAGIQLIPQTSESNFISIQSVACIRKDEKGQCRNDVIGESTGGFGLELANKNGHIIKIKKGLDTRLMKHTVLHEIGHALGAIHEHSHPDASKYIAPTESAIREGIGTKSYTSAESLTRFDIKSIMLYCDFFRKKRSPANQQEMRIAINNPSAPPLTVKNTVCEPGKEPIELSEDDIRGFLRMYKNEINKRRPFPIEPKSGHYLVYLSRYQCSPDRKSMNFGGTGYSIDQPHLIFGNQVRVLQKYNSQKGLSEVTMLSCGKREPRVEILGVFEARLPYRRLAYPDYSLTPVKIFDEF